MENNQSVCYVGKINEIKEIPGCDNIMSAKINDWNTIVRKGGYKVGDLVGVAVTDAVLPEEMVERLDIKNYLRKGCRVRTVKLKGVYSECLVFDVDSNYKEGQDLMTDFNVVKYEEPVKMINISVPKVYFKWNKIHKLGMWKRWINYQINKFRKKYSYKENPNFNIYYKFPNFKNVPDIFTEEDQVVITRKIHGTNARYGVVKRSNLNIFAKIKHWFTKNPFDLYEFVYGSHRVEKGSDSQGFYSTDVWKEIMDKYQLKEKLWNMIKRYPIEEIGSGFILYGEIYGPGIQKNYDYNLKEIEFKAFDIEINSEFMSDLTFRAKCNVYEIPTVDKLYRGNWSKEKQESYNGDLIPNTKIPEEGIVIKSIDGNKRKRAKVVNSNYLIYAEKHNVTDEH